MIEAKKIAAWEFALNQSAIWAMHYFFFMLQENNLFMDNTPHTYQYIAEKVNLYETQHKQLACLLLLLEEYQLICQLADGRYQWISSAVFHKNDLLNKAEKLLNDYPDIKENTLFLIELMPQYLNILANKRSLLSVLFEQGKFDRINALYKKSVIANYYNTITTNTTLKKLKIYDCVLEIGAGVGSISQLLLEKINTLSLPVQYTYSDISPAFLNYGKHNFSKLSDNISFRKFDINIPFVTQGFQAKSFNFIIAANALHIASDITFTVNNLFELLIPGGTLILNEPIIRNPYSEIVYGLTSSWYSCTDAQYRLGKTPIISLPNWQQLLKQSGFKQIRTEVKSANTQQQIITATKPLTGENRAI